MKKLISFILVNAIFLGSVQAGPLRTFIKIISGVFTTFVVTAEVASAIERSNRELVVKVCREDEQSVFYPERYRVCPNGSKPETKIINPADYR